MLLKRKADFKKIDDGVEYSPRNTGFFFTFSFFFFNVLFSFFFSSEVKNESLQLNYCSQRRCLVRLIKFCRLLLLLVFLVSILIFLLPRLYCFGTLNILLLHLCLLQLLLFFSFFHIGELFVLHEVLNAVWSVLSKECRLPGVDIGTWKPLPL